MSVIKVKFDAVHHKSNMHSTNKIYFGGSLSKSAHAPNTEVTRSPKLSSEYFSL